MTSKQYVRRVQAYVFVAFKFRKEPCVSCLVDSKHSYLFL